MKMTITPYRIFRAVISLMVGSYALYRGLDTDNWWRITLGVVCFLLIFLEFIYPDDEKEKN